MAFPIPPAAHGVNNSPVQTPWSAQPVPLAPLPPEAEDLLMRAQKTIEYQQLELERLRPQIEAYEFLKRVVGQFARDTLTMGGRDHDPVSNRIAGYLEALAKQKLEDVENGKV
jgi:hypothetical protein